MYINKSCLRNLGAAMKLVMQKLANLTEKMIDRGLTTQAATSKEALEKLIQNYQDSLPGGKADARSPKDFDSHQLMLGVDVELEHTDDPKVALEIAIDHLTEDSKYYTKLQKMESGFKKEMGMKHVIAKLITIANELDNAGLLQEANEVDLIVESLSPTVATLPTRKLVDVTPQVLVEWNPKLLAKPLGDADLPPENTHVRATAVVKVRLLQDGTVMQAGDPIQSGLPADKTFVAKNLAEVKKQYGAYVAQLKTKFAVREPVGEMINYKP